MFEDISTFDAENPIAGSLLREIDISKKQSDSDFIKCLPSQPGKEFKIKKRLDKLRGNSSGFGTNNNNNNNFGPPGNNFGGSDLFGPAGTPPPVPRLEDFLDGDPSNPSPSPPPAAPFNNLLNNNAPIQPPSSNFTPENVSAVPNFSMLGIGNNLFG